MSKQGILHISAKKLRNRYKKIVVLGWVFWKFIQISIYPCPRKLCTECHRSSSRSGRTPCSPSWRSWGRPRCCSWSCASHHLPQWKTGDIRQKLKRRKSWPIISYGDILYWIPPVTTLLTLTTTLLGIVSSQCEMLSLWGIEMNKNQRFGRVLRPTIAWDSPAKK